MNHVKLCADWWRAGVWSFGHPVITSTPYPLPHEMEVTTRRHAVRFRELAAAIFTSRSDGAPWVSRRARGAGSTNASVWPSLASWQQTGENTTSFRSAKEQLQLALPFILDPAHEAIRQDRRRRAVHRLTLPSCWRSSQHDPVPEIIPAQRHVELLSAKRTDRLSTAG